LGATPASRAHTGREAEQATCGGELPGPSSGRAPRRSQPSLPLLRIPILSPPRRPSGPVRPRRCVPQTRWRGRTARPVRMYGSPAGAAARAPRDLHPEFLACLAREPVRRMLPDPQKPSRQVQAALLRIPRPHGHQGPLVLDYHGPDRRRRAAEPRPPAKGTRRPAAGPRLPQLRPVRRAVAEGLCGREGNHPLFSFKFSPRPTPRRCCIADPRYALPRSGRAKVCRGARRTSPKTKPPGFGAIRTLVHRPAHPVVRGDA
jgi:hypothetical protein